MIMSRSCYQHKSNFYPGYTTITPDGMNWKLMGSVTNLKKKICIVQTAILAYLSIFEYNFGASRFTQWKFTIIDAHRVPFKGVAFGNSSGMSETSLKGLRLIIMTFISEIDGRIESLIKIWNERRFERNRSFFSHFPWYAKNDWMKFWNWAFNHFLWEI